LAAVPVTDPLGILHGTDNQFTFITSRYREQPLVITGPGAGPAVTAAGVFNDLLRVEQLRKGSKVRRSPIRDSRVEERLLRRRRPRGRRHSLDSPPKAPHGRSCMVQHTTVGRLLERMYEDSPATRDAVVHAAGVAPERSDAAAIGALRLSLSEQLRL